MLKKSYPTYYVELFFALYSLTFLNLILIDVTILWPFEQGRAYCFANVAVGRALI